MNKRIMFILVALAMSACSPMQNRTSPDVPVIASPQENIPNPASVYCEQNGNKLEIHNAADGSQIGVCVFPDGSTCDEWAYFKGECSSAALNAPTSALTYEPTQKGNNDDAGENASGGYMAPGTSEPISDWWGVIKSTPSGAQFDDYFERQDLGGAIYFGIDSLDPIVKAQIEALRDSGKIVHLNGTLLSNVLDYNGSQVQVDHIVVEE